MFSVQGAKFLLFFGILGLSGIFFGFLFSGLESRGGKKAPSAATSGADIRLSGFFLQEHDGGKPQFRISAREAEFFEEINQIELDTVQGTLITREGLEVSFHGERGVVDTVSRNIILERGDKDLEVELSNGFKIDAKRLEWDAGSRHLTSVDPVQLSGHGVIIKGQDFLLSLDQQILSLNKNVYLTYTR